jgi:hypothetical protein
MQSLQYESILLQMEMAVLRNDSLMQHHKLAREKTSFCWRQVP